MDSASTEDHWETVYRNKAPEEVSWYQTEPSVSLELIQLAGVNPGDAIIDIGAGASRLVDCLLSLGFADLSVLDVSSAAISATRERLGDRSTAVTWMVEDVLSFHPERRYALWHDRACFHFMTSAKQRQLYVDAMKRAVNPGGSAIIATFAPDGPRRCSGREIVRYDESLLLQQLGSGWQLQHQLNELHHTPWDAEQSFQYFLLRRD